MSDDEGSEWLIQILKDVQLEQFYVRIRDELQVSRLVHFDYVTSEDLEKIGMGKPGTRRLLDAVKKRRTKIRNKNIVNKILPPSISQSKLSKSGQSSSGAIKKSKSSSDNQGGSPITCLIQEKDLELGSKLGDGSFGVVVQGSWKTSFGTVIPVAVKVLKESTGANLPGMLQEFVREVQSINLLRHPNLIKLHGIVLGSPLMMVTELAELGSLLDYLRKQCGHTSILDLSRWALQITSGMQYLESQRCVHRDLACRNILLSSQHEVKICDFGLMKILPNEIDCYVMTERQKVPFPWCAPESLKARQFSHASDTWMFGVVMFEMFSFGEEPWIDLNGQQILTKIDKEGERLQQPDACPPSLYQVMLQCWAKDPSERPTFSALRAYLAETFPVEMQALQAFQEDGESDKLTLEEGEKVVIIDGKKENYYWKGQSQKTFNIGFFPRCVVSPLRRRQTDDISMPLRNSFIHTGHGSISEKSWGSPSFIDEVYLKNPMEPADKSGIIAEESEETTDAPRLPNRSKKQNSSNNNPLRSVQKTQQIQQQYSYSKFQNESASEVDWSMVPKTKVNDVTTKSSEGILIDLNEDNAGSPNLYKNTGTSLIDYPIETSSRGGPPERPPPPHLANGTNSMPSASYRNELLPSTSYGNVPFSSTNNIVQVNDVRDSRLQPKISNILANAQYSSQNPTRDVYKAAGSIYSVATVDSAEWSQNSETCSMYNDCSSPDPFDTSNILTPPSTASRYYSFVPHSPTSADVEISPSNQLRLMKGATPDDGYSGSPALRNYTPEESPTRKLESIKPPMELLKKRDEAFSWLDDALGGLSIGSTTSKSGNSPRNDSRVELTPQQPQQALPKVASSSSSRSFSSTTLDSGDEAWASYRFQDVPSPATVKMQSTHPYALPPPPSITRNSSLPSMINSNPNSLRPSLPAYRPPPPLQLHSQQSHHSPQMANVRSPSIANGNAVNGLMQAVQILSPKVPTAAVESIVDALRRSNGSIAEAERLLKVNELCKLGLGTNSRCEAVLSRTNWNMEAAASVLLEEMS